MTSTGGQANWWCAARALDLTGCHCLRMSSRTLAPAADDRAAAEVMVDGRWSMVDGSASVGHVGNSESFKGHTEGRAFVDPSEQALTQGDRGVAQK
jgi:hypothetical protein